MSEVYIVNVPVATVWTSPASPREIDAPMLSASCRADEWLRRLDDAALLDLCESNRVQTQVLYGEEVLLVEQKDGWSRVVIPNQPSSKHNQGYPGWIPTCQLTRKQENRAYGQLAMVTSRKAALKTEKEQEEIVLSFATLLPVHRLEGDWAIVQTPTGYGSVAASDVKIYQGCETGSNADFIKSGEQFIGLPYLWGGMSSFGYDCSGFVYNMCRANGYRIPRDASEQAFDGKEVALSELKPGDLLFFAYEQGKGEIHHVGFYYGDGKMLHSPKTGRPIEIIDLNGTLYEQELCAARRYGAEETI
ncbi:MAG: NlpC/P60 family protein [Bacillus sp. (in: firmicutes)]